MNCNNTNNTNANKNMQTQKTITYSIQRANYNDINALRNMYTNTKKQTPKKQ